MAPAAPTAPTTHMASTAPRPTTAPRPSTATYPQESAGVTLLSCEHGGERRRVFVRRRGTRLEVGEFTRGPLTYELYDAPAHHHCIQLGAPASRLLAQRLSERQGVPREQGIADLLRAYFVRDERFLADLMDLLDSQSVPYGYLNSMMGKYVAYRPEHRYAS